MRSGLRYANINSMVSFDFNPRQLYISLFTNSIMPIVLSDGNDRILDANRRFCSMLGYTKEEMLSMSLKDIVPDKVKKRGQSVVLSDIQTHRGEPFETVDIAKDGRQIPVEVSVFKLKSGKQTLYFSIVKDITERKASEKKLIQREKQYRNVFENAGISIWEEDFSRLLEKLDELKKTGVSDLREYISRHPDFVFDAVSLIKVRNINKETVKLLGAESKKQILGSLEKFFDPGQIGVIKEEIMAIWDGKSKFISELKYFTLEKKPLTLLMDIKFPAAKEEFKHVIVSFMDITILKETEASLTKAIEEKRTLLKELYHRTKNNMQMIGSLLTLKASYAEDEKVGEVFDDMKNRIQSMSLVHEKLYQSESLYSIRLDDYIKDIVNSLKSSYAAAAGNVLIESDMDKITVSIEQAIPMGIILNELLANAFKYAFPGGTGGKIELSLHKREERKIQFRLRDNGTGVPEGFDFRTHNSLGMQLIFSIAEEQLKGKINYAINNGISWELTFPA